MVGVYGGDMGGKYGRSGVGKNRSDLDSDEHSAGRPLERGSHLTLVYRLRAPAGPSPRPRNPSPPSASSSPRRRLRHHDFQPMMKSPSVRSAQRRSHRPRIAVRQHDLHRMLYEGSVSILFSTRGLFSYAFETNATRSPIAALPLPRLVLLPSPSCTAGGKLRAVRILFELL